MLSKNNNDKFWNLCLGLFGALGRLTAQLQSNKKTVNTSNIIPVRLNM